MGAIKKQKKLDLTTQIFIGLILGVITGILLCLFLPRGSLPYNIIVEGVLRLFGQGFIRLMQMLVVPLVFFSLVCGSMAMDDTRKLGRIGIKTLLFYLTTTALAVALALMVANLINPGMGLDISALHVQPPKIEKAPSIWQTLLEIIPTNPIAAFANANMMQIILFALITGILLAHLGEKTPYLSGIMREGDKLMGVMTHVVMLLAPIGVFCLVARTFAQTGFSAFLPMLKYIAAVLLGLSLQILGVYQSLLWILARINPLRFFQKFLPVFGFAFSTASSNATIPLNIENITERMGVSPRIASFTIPLGATINMDGTAIMQGVAVVFVAQVFGITLSPADYITIILTATLASVGTAGVPGVGLITLSMVLQSAGLPLEGIGLIIGIDRLVDMFRTAVNVTGDAVCTAIIAVGENGFDQEIFNRKDTDQNS